MSVEFYPSKFDDNVGSQRIYGSHLCSALASAGLLSHSGKSVKLIIVGRGFLKNFRKSGGFQQPREIRVIAANPDSAIFDLEPWELEKISAFIVGSQEESWSLEEFGKKTYVIPQRENTSMSSLKRHLPEEELSLVYHGNRQHLDEIRSEVIEGIGQASKEINVNLKLIYDIKNLGKVSLRLPCKIEHIQWERETLWSDIQAGNVGFVPNLLGYKSTKGSILLSSYFKHARPSQTLMFKRTSNAGRALLFADLGLPILGEPTPSMVGLIPSPKYGHLVTSASGWRDALISLSEANNRSRVAKALHWRANNTHEFDFQKLAIEMIEEICRPSL